MGVILSSIVNGLFFSKKPTQILMVGLDGAGKTTILFQLKLGYTGPTIPTIGFNCETVNYKNISFTIWDVRGEPTKLWKHYFEGMDGLIFVIDSNERERVEEAKHALHFVLAAEELKNTVLLVFANKQDLPNVMSNAELMDKLKLNNLRDRRWHIQAASATEGNGLYEGLDWLSNELAK